MNNLEFYLVEDSINYAIEDICEVSNLTKKQLSSKYGLNDLTKSVYELISNQNKEALIFCKDYNHIFMPYRTLDTLISKQLISSYK